MDKEIDLEKEWKRVKARYRLDSREIELAKLLHWSPSDLEAKAPSKKEPWKDEPALHIRRSFDKLRRHLKPERFSSEWFAVMKKCFLDSEEVREAIEMKMSPEDVMGITDRTALTIRRAYDKNFWTELKNPPSAKLNNK